MERRRQPRLRLDEVKQSNVMKADKGQFDEVLRRLLAKPPKKNSEIKKPRKKSVKTSPK